MKGDTYKVWHSKVLTFNSFEALVGQPDLSLVRYAGRLSMIGMAEF